MHGGHQAGAAAGQYIGEEQCRGQVNVRKYQCVISESCDLYHLLSELTFSSARLSSARAASGHVVCLRCAFFSCKCSATIFRGLDSM